MAKVSDAARVNLLPAKHLLFSKQFKKTSSFRGSGSLGPGGRGQGAEVKPAPKPSLNMWGCECNISSRSVQGFGFPLTLHIPTEVQTNICIPTFTDIEDIFETLTPVPPC